MTAPRCNHPLSESMLSAERVFMSGYKVFVTVQARCLASSRSTLRSMSAQRRHECVSQRTSRQMEPPARYGTRVGIARVVVPVCCPWQNKEVTRGAEGNQAMFRQRAALSR